MEKREMQELSNEEVNVYGNCYECKNPCLCDCPDLTPFISVSY